MIVSSESALGTQMTATTDHYGSNEDCEYLDFQMHLSTDGKKMTKLDS